MENQEILKNNLKISIDWLSFTILDDSFTVEKVISFLGFQFNDFRVMPNGANGYKRMRKYEDISILYDGMENMGIHVNVTGSSVAMLFEAYKESLLIDTPFGKAYDGLWETTVLSHFFSALLKIGCVSRLDFAIDDIGAKYYSVNEVVEKQKQGRIVSKWRIMRNITESVLSSNTEVGHTVYFGSGQSTIMLRLYDKKLERNKALKEGDKNYCNEEWVRWELELKKDRANEAARLLAQGTALGKVAVGVLSHYFRIVELDDSNKSRCSNDSKWDLFIDEISRLRIFVKKEPKSLDEERLQWEHQNGRKVAKMFEYMGGDLGYFGDLACRYRDRLTVEDKLQLSAYWKSFDKVA